MFDFSSYLPKSQFLNDSNKLVVRKVKDKTAGVAVKELDGLKLEMHYFFLDNGR